MGRQAHKVNNYVKGCYKTHTDVRLSSEQILEYLRPVWEKVGMGTD